MAHPVSPYHVPGFYAEALARGRHRDIVGGRWDETGRIQMQILIDAGLRPDHHLLDLGAGSLRLGCKAVGYLHPGHYWATDLSGALLRRGYETEIADKTRLSPDHLIEDTDFGFPGVPATITHVMAFAVFTHLPAALLGQALTRLRSHFPALQSLFFTVFLAPDAAAARGPLRQPDGVVTHGTRAPYHMLASAVLDLNRAAGFDAAFCDTRLPRGQALFHATPRPDDGPAGQR